MGEQVGNLTMRLVRLPRLIRIVIALFFATMVTLAISPLVDHIYLRFFFTTETVIVPAMVTVSIASIMYIWGWWGFVGTINTVPQASKYVFLYFVVGIVATISVIILFIQGITSLQ